MADSKDTRKPGRPRVGRETAEGDFLDAAERHFAEFGFAGATIRAIAKDAKANLGALHYYWGSKEALFRAVCLRRLEPILVERMDMLEAIARDAAETVPSIEAVLRAYFNPAFLRGLDDLALRSRLGGVMVRVLTDPAPEVQAVNVDLFDQTTIAFVRLLRQACPHLDDQSFFWRMHGVLGAFQFSVSGSKRVKHVSDNIFDADRIEFGAAEIIAFVAAGLRAPAPDGPEIAPVRQPAANGIKQVT